MQQIKYKSFLLKGMRLTSWLIAFIGKILLAIIVVLLIINIFEIINIKWEDMTSIENVKSLIAIHYNNFKLYIILLLVGFIFVFLTRLVFKFFYFSRDKILYQFNHKKWVYIFRNTYNVYALIAILSTFTAVVIAYVIISTNVQSLFSSIQVIVDQVIVDKPSEIPDNIEKDIAKAFENFVDDLRNAFLSNNPRAIVFYFAIGISGLDIIFITIYIIVSLISKFGKFNKNDILSKLSNSDKNPPPSNQTSSLNDPNQAQANTPVDSTTNINNDYFVDDNSLILAQQEQETRNTKKLQADLLQPSSSELDNLAKVDLIDFNNQREATNNDNVWGASFQPLDEEDK